MVEAGKTQGPRNIGSVYAGAGKHRAFSRNGPYPYREVSPGVMCWTLSLSTGGYMVMGFPYIDDSKLNHSSLVPVLRCRPHP